MTLSKAMEAEREVLGYLLHRRAKASSIFRSLVETDFYLSYHRFLFSTLQKDFAHQYSWRLEYILLRFKSQGNLYAAGGRDYILMLKSIGKRDYEIKDIELYIVNMKKASMARQLSKEQKELFEKALTEKGE